MSASHRLTATDIQPHLTTRWLGRTLHCFDEVGSTNTVARELARGGAEAGLAVVADAQTQGRGRMGRIWASPAGRNVYLSVVLRPTLPTELVAQMSVLAGVATCDAISEWYPATIKWPNDVLVGGRKVAGILIEMEAEGTARFLVVGIGVNLNAKLTDFPPELREKVGSIRLATGHLVDRPRFVSRLLHHLEERYTQLQAHGFAPIAEAWRERSLLIGKEITVAEPAGTIVGTVLGLDNDGALRLRLASGAEHRVLAGDVTVVGGYTQSGSH